MQTHNLPLTEENVFRDGIMGGAPSKTTHAKLQICTTVML